MTVNKVALVVPGDIRTRTGGYEYDRQIVNALRARGWEVDVKELGGTYPRPSLRDRAVAAETLAGLPDGSLALIDGLAMGTLPEVMSLQRGRVRLVALVHHPLALETGIDTAERNRLFESERLALASARAVVVTSPATVGTLNSYGLACGVAVVVPGTDAAPAARGSGGPPVRLLCVASLVPRKGHAALLQALGALAEFEWHLVCGGGERDAHTGPMLRSQVRAGGLDGRVTFAGELSEEALDEEYDRADVFVLPSLFEGYGMVVAEALARGLPVVTTDTGGTADLLARGGGIVCPPGDVAALTRALRTVIGDADVRARLRNEAMAVRGRLQTWADAAVKMEKVLMQVLVS